MFVRSKPRSHASLVLSILGILLGADARAGAQDRSTTETTAGRVKSPKNPVLGGDLGTCFDNSVLKDGDTDRMAWEKHRDNPVSRPDPARPGRRTG